LKPYTPSRGPILLFGGKGQQQGSRWKSRKVHYLNKSNIFLLDFGNAVFQTVLILTLIYSVNFEDKIEKEFCLFTSFDVHSIVYNYFDLFLNLGLVGLNLIFTVFKR
jgi:hypothetical protein